MPLAGGAERRRPIQQSLIAELQDEGKQQSLTAKFAETQDSLIVTGISPDGFAMSLSDGSVKIVPQALFDRLSFTHIVQLLHVEDSMQRAFYAIEAMRGAWSVRELQRQIDTNYYVRSGWSKKPELLSKKSGRSRCSWVLLGRDVGSLGKGRGFPIGFFLFLEGSVYRYGMPQSAAISSAVRPVYYFRMCAQKGVCVWFVRRHGGVDK